MSPQDKDPRHHTQHIRKRLSEITTICARISRKSISRS